MVRFQESETKSREGALLSTVKPFGHGRERVCWRRYRASPIRSAGAIGLVLAICQAHAADPPRTVVVVPNEHYRVGWVGRIFLGSNWRDLWTTPIQVPVLDLGSFDGGLTPDREGGGLQTKSLHFRSASGRHWDFRSLDKDPTRVLEPDIRQSLLGALAQDLTSVENPAGALITAPFLDAAGVLHPSPSLYVMPDDPRLGEFRSSFAGMLGLIESHDEKRLPGVDKVLTTYELFERLEKRSDERVDARDYLRARLIDIFVGDWDRHVDQWRWVRFQEGSARIWRSVPRDRDEALSRFNGVIPTIVEYYTKQLAGFGADYPSIEKLTFAGRYTDRWFLVGLEKPEWDAVTADLVAKLTNATIDDAVHQMPKEFYAKQGARIRRMLRSRRDQLPRASEDFYRLLAQDVDVRGTEGGDDVEVLRHPDRSVELTLYSRDGGSGQRVGAPFFHRTFKSDETDEIRLYLLGGADRVVLQGTGEKSIPVRIIALGDQAQIIDQSHCGGCTDIRRESGKVAAKNVRGTDIEPTHKELQARFEPTRDWGWDLLFFPQLTYDTSRGLVAGALGVFTSYGFELEPFSNQTRFGAAYSTGTSQPRVDLATKFRTGSPLSILGFISYSGMDQVFFFGLGNQTPRIQQLDNAGFYQTTQKRFILHPLLDVEIAGPFHASVGGLFEHVSNVDRNTLAAQTPGFRATSLMAVETNLALDVTQTRSLVPRGFKASVFGRYYPSVLDLNSDFLKVRGSAAYFLPFRLLTDILLGVQVAGEKNWGTYPPFEAAFLGGIPGAVGLDPGTFTGNLLRGYDLNRFAGDASLVGNVDLRIAIGSWNSVLPIRYGLLGVFDIGRVFFTPESSTKWHKDGGGGLWATILLAVPGYRIVSTLNGVVVASEDRTSFTLYSGLSF